MAELLLYKGLAFRSMHAHGRALNGLLPHAVDDVEALRRARGRADRRRGRSAGTSATATSTTSSCSRRCRSAATSPRASCGWSMIESQPAHEQRQHYRIYDAASGLIEEGYVQVADMVERQPWLDETGHVPGRGDRRERRRRGRPPRRWRSERGDRRRLRPERAGVRGRARARGREGDRAGGRADDRRRHPHAAS